MKLRVAIHKNSVIWLTTLRSRHLIAASCNCACELQRHFTDPAVIELLLGRYSVLLEMTNSIWSRTVRVGQKWQKKNRIHGPACERRLRTVGLVLDAAVSPPGDRPVGGSCPAVVPERDGATRNSYPPGHRQLPSSLGLFRRAHPRKERD
jgi:hypothetical protein